MSDDLMVLGLIGIAFFVVAVASYPAAIVAGWIVSAFVRKEERKPVGWAFWTNLVPALTAPVAVAGLAGILWALPQNPDGRFTVALAGAVAIAIPAWSVVYRLAYRVPAKSAIVGALCVPMVAVPITIMAAWAFGTLAAVLIAVFSTG